MTNFKLGVKASNDVIKEEDEDLPDSGNVSSNRQEEKQNNKQVNGRVGEPETQTLMSKHKNGHKDTKDLEENKEHERKQQRRLLGERKSRPYQREYEQVDDDGADIEVKY